MNPVQDLIDHLLDEPMVLLDFRAVSGTGPTTADELASAILGALKNPGDPITAADLDATMPLAIDVDQLEIPCYTHDKQGGPNKTWNRPT